MVTKEELEKEEFNQLSGSNLVIQDLNELPDKIKEKELTCYGLSNNISTQESSAKECEVFAMAIISKEIDQDGKKLFTNEDARQSELQKRLRSNETHAEATKSMNFLKDKLAKETIEMNYLKNKFSAAKYLSRLYVSRSDEE